MRDKYQSARFSINIDNFELIVCRTLCVDTGACNKELIFLTLPMFTVTFEAVLSCLLNNFDHEQLYHNHRNLSVTSLESCLWNLDVAFI